MMSRHLVPRGDLPNLRLFPIFLLIAVSAGCDGSGATQWKTQPGHPASVPVVTASVDTVAQKKGDSEVKRDSVAEVRKFDEAGKITRQFAENVALDRVAGNRGNRDRLTAGAIRHDKYWHTPESGGDAVLISGWSVTVWMRPATPDGFYTLFVADDGSVKDFRGAP